MKKTLPALLILLLILAACSNENEESNDTELTIYTTVFPLTSFVKEIAGETVTVESIYPPGVDMHSYEPTQKDMMSYSDADLFITTSNALDPVAASIANTINKNTTIVETALNINHSEVLEMHHDHDHEEGDDHHHGSLDPHIWLNPLLALQMAEAVKDALIEHNPNSADLYNENFEILKSDIEQLDKQLIEITEDPVNTDVYISHESIGYLAHQYGFHQVGISGLNNQEPSQQELTQIIENIKAENIPYILYEPNVTSNVTDVIRKETNAEPLYFNNLETLTKDDPADATYQSMMEKNIDVLGKALNNN